MNSLAQSQPGVSGVPLPPSPDRLRPFWISWWQDLGIGFELHSPWWISGNRYTGAVMVEQASICAAIMATDELDAQRRVVAAHYREPHFFELRFVLAKDRGWSPFCDRFPRADWMVWPVVQQPRDEPLNREPGHGG